jgi:RNase P subunit RPR2
MSRYPKIEAGQRVRVRWRRKDLKMACCDCGLVHRFRFNVKRGVLTMRGWRDNRATGQIRRRMKHG